MSAEWRESIKEFKYNIRFIYSDDRTQILDYNNPTNILTTYYEGMTLGEIWGYETLGFFGSEDEVENSPDQTQLFSTWNPGDVKYKDLNDDNEITRGENTFDDPGDRKVIGNNLPRHSVGISVGATFKGFDLNMLWQGVARRDVVLETNTFFGFAPNGIPHISLKEPALDFWTEDNRGAYFARPYITEENNKNQVAQTRYLQDASYIRLKNLQFGYTIPSQILNKIKMDNLRLFFSGENLLTFTNLVEGIDPEATYGQGSNSSGRVYPMGRVLSFGLQITL